MSARWTPERGWHESDEAMRLVLDSRGRIHWVPETDDPNPESEQA